MKKVILFILTIFLSTAVFAQNKNLMYFDGSNDYLKLDDNTKMDNLLNGATDYTIEMWVYPNSTSIHNKVLLKRWYQFAVTMYQDANKRFYFTHYDNTGASTYINSTNNALNIGEWNHIAIVCSSVDNRVYLYANGVEVTDGTPTALTLRDDKASDNMYVGYGGSGTYPDVFMDEIRVMNISSTIASLNTDKTDTPYTTNANTALLLHLDEGTGYSKTYDEASTDSVRMGSAVVGDNQEPTWTAWNASSMDYDLPFASVTIDGSIDELTLYDTLATKQNTNAGWGAIDVTNIFYYPDRNNSVLYLAIEGKLDVASDNGIGLWIDIDGAIGTGAGSGSSLGIAGGGHYIDGNAGADLNFKADFEVDYMFAINPGSATTNVYFDAASQVGTAAHYQGTCDQIGSVSSNSSADGTVFTKDAIKFAFNNDGFPFKGFEFSIPFSEIGATANYGIKAFAFVVSATGYFSNITVPGNITGADPGANADFSTLSGTYGAFVSGNKPLPVELTSFTASKSGNSVILNWETATEVNNYGFDVESSNDNNNWNVIGFVEGHGNSNSPQNYSFVATDGAKYYRLKQVDTDGSSEYSNVVEVKGNLSYKLSQNHPNPFNPTTKINFSIPEAAKVSITIFNALGQDVAELANREFTKGNHSVDFNATNLTSGIYFYRMNSANFSKTMKMMLLK